MSVIDVPTLERMARQYGVISVRQLSAELGWSASAIGRARRSGTLRTVAPGVVQMISDRETFESRCMAAVLATNGAGFLSGWSAARLYGLRKMPDSPIHMTVPHHFRLVNFSTIDLHRSKWYDRQEDFVTRPDGLRIATPMRMLFGIAAAFNQFRFERAAEDAWHLGLVTPDLLAEYLQVHRCRGKDGVRTIERWLDKRGDALRAVQSGLELELIEELEQIGLPKAERQHPLRLATGETIHLDIAWPDIRFAVEPGASWWHGGDLGQRRDQDRDRAAGEVGWLIVRFDEAMRKDVSGSARQVRRIHQRRSDDLGNVHTIVR